MDDMDDTEELLRRSSFHDSELARFERSGTDLHLVFRNVILSLDDDDYYRVEVTLSGVGGMTRDDEPVSAVGLEGEGSTVLQFDRAERDASLSVIWISYAPRRQEFATYRFSFDRAAQAATLQVGFE